MMISSFIFIAVTSSFCYGLRKTSIDLTLPKWPEKYHVKGQITLPYAELEEPFEGWYDGPNKRSRIDFYGGVSKTIQRGDLGTYGKLYAIFPTTTETVRNKISCFIENGKKGHHYVAQPLLPNFANFKYIGNDTYKGSPVYSYRLKVSGGKLGNKRNTYTLFVDKERQLPVFYKMLGLNNVIWGHYDKYNIDYFEWSFDFSPNIFEEPIRGAECKPWVNWDHSTRIVANPMQEYIHPTDDTHVHHMHAEFMKKYKKDIGEDNDHRKNIFKHNLRYIHSMNRRNLTYKLKVNHLADRSDEELKRLSGLRITPRDQRGDVGLDFVATTSPNGIPNQKNWRLYGAVTPVKDQANCGSCWSYGVAGTLEGTLFLKTGKLLRLSQQQMVDCSWGFGNYGCYGGEAWRAYKYLIKHGGLSTEEDYGPYLAVNGYCRDNKVDKAVNVSGYVNVPAGNETAMKIALSQKGPITVAMDVAHKSFTFFGSGVYYEPKCKTDWDSLSHQMLAVGYGTHMGEPYWLIKNSWSTYWGNDGYFLISRKDNHCGILTDASYGIVN